MQSLQTFASIYSLDSWFLCSVCPPYLKVSYEELFNLLEDSPLLHEETYIVVEYPTKISFSLPEKIGPPVPAERQEVWPD